MKIKRVTLRPGTMIACGLILIAWIAAEGKSELLSGPSRDSVAMVDEIAPSMDPNDLDVARFLYNKRNWNAGKKGNGFFPLTGASNGNQSPEGEESQDADYSPFFHENLSSLESWEHIEKTRTKRRRTTRRPMRRKTKVTPEKYGSNEYLKIKIKRPRRKTAKQRLTSTGGARETKSPESNAKRRQRTKNPIGGSKKTSKNTSPMSNTT